MYKNSINQSVYDGTICGGFHGCKKRSYAPGLEDCEECRLEVIKTMEKVEKLVLVDRSF